MVERGISEEDDPHLQITNLVNMRRWENAIHHLTGRFSLELMREFYVNVLNKKDFTVRIRMSMCFGP